MRHSSLLCVALAISGCSAAKSAMGVLSPKPQPITVVTSVATAPAPTLAPAAAADRPAMKTRGFFEKVGIVTTSVVVGAGLGALASEALDTDTTTSALIGAGVGAAAGVAIAD